MMIFQLWQGSFPFWQEAFLQLALQKHTGMHAGIKALHCQHCGTRSLWPSRCKHTDGLHGCPLYVSTYANCSEREKKYSKVEYWVLCRHDYFVTWKGFLEKNFPTGSFLSYVEYAKSKDCDPDFRWIFNWWGFYDD